ncbi:hypothetical protein [Streptosporangium sp. NPDC002721]|uniref:hypothetical protein n=1 Tax=Streptosporangium sp. NPDC002721 TaxID=3366188 RepID=UPI0036761AA5
MYEHPVDVSIIETTSAKDLTRRECFLFLSTPHRFSFVSGLLSALFRRVFLNPCRVFSALVTTTAGWFGESAAPLLSDVVQQMLCNFVLLFLLVCPEFGVVGLVDPHAGRAFGESV